MNTLQRKKVGSVTKIVSFILMLILALSSFTFDAAGVEVGAIEETAVEVCGDDCDGHDHESDSHENEEVYYYETVTIDIFSDESIGEYEQLRATAGCSKHEYTYNVKAATCTKAGSVQCRWCGVSKTIAKLQHKFKNMNTGCETKVIWKCTVCGFKETGKIMGHQWYVYQKPTKKATGIEKCMVDGCGKTRTIPKLK